MYFTFKEPRDDQSLMSVKKIYLLKNWHSLEKL